MRKTFLIIAIVLFVALAILIILQFKEINGLKNACVWDNSNTMHWRVGLIKHMNIDAIKVFLYSMKNSSKNSSMGCTAATVNIFPIDLVTLIFLFLILSQRKANIKGAIAGGFAGLLVGIFYGIISTDIRDLHYYDYNFSTSFLVRLAILTNFFALIGARLKPKYNKLALIILGIVTIIIVIGNLLI